MKETGKLFAAKKYYVNITLKEDEYFRLRNISEELHFPMATITRLALQDYYKKLEKEGKIVLNVSSR